MDAYDLTYVFRGVNTDGVSMRLVPLRMISACSILGEAATTLARFIARHLRALDSVSIMCSMACTEMARVRILELRLDFSVELKITLSPIVFFYGLQFRIHSFRSTAACGFPPSLVATFAARM